MDLIKIHGHRPKADIDVLVGDTLDFIQSRGLAIARGIPFTTASDVHSNVQLGENYARLAEKIEKLGIREVSVFEEHQRTACTL